MCFTTVSIFNGQADALHIALVITCFAELVAQKLIKDTEQEAIPAAHHVQIILSHGFGKADIIFLHGLGICDLPASCLELGENGFGILALCHTYHILLLPQGDVGNLKIIT